MPAPSLVHRLKHKDPPRLATLFLAIAGVLGFSLLCTLWGSSSNIKAKSTQACPLTPKSQRSPLQLPSSCNLAEGKWVLDPSRSPAYGDSCPFQRNAWNCGKNKRPGLLRIYQWKWVPQNCTLPAIDPHKFMHAIKNMRIGFVGDSLNENFLVSLLCILSTADPGASKWKKKKAWRGAFFPKYNVTVAYHRAVLLADYEEWRPTRPDGELESRGFTNGVRVNVDVPANDWINILNDYDIFVFNTGHWWGLDKFPASNPLIFYNQGKPIIPPLGLRDGLEVVLQHMISYLERSVPSTALKIWRLQSPRHFEGGEWSQNGSCLSNTLLEIDQVENWFGLGKGGVNREAREFNAIITKALKGSSFHVLNISYLSEFRRDAHPAIWLGQKNAHVIWGQDCMHWCLPGLPDIWVDMLSTMVLDYLQSRKIC